jgi:hypothetical protein
LIPLRISGPPDEPPLVPANDELLSENDPFVQKCHEHASSMIAIMNLELTDQLVTESKSWGIIWRADFKFPRSDTTFINRLMAWEREEKVFFSTSVGQNVPPLQPAHDKARWQLAWPGVSLMGIILPRYGLMISFAAASLTSSMDWSKGAPPPMRPPFDRSKLHCPPPPFKPPSQPFGCRCEK